MNRYAAPLAVLRRARVAAWLAFAAAFLQTVAVTASLAMQAMQANGDPAVLDRVAALYLCHSGDDGASGNDTPSTKPSSPCMLCQTAQMAGHGILPAMAAGFLPFDYPQALIFVALTDRLPVGVLLRYGTARGPPSLVRA